MSTITPTNLHTADPAAAAIVQDADSTVDSTSPGNKTVATKVAESNQSKIGKGSVATPKNEMGDTATASDGDKEATGKVGRESGRQDEVEAKIEDQTSAAVATNEGTIGAHSEPLATNREVSSEPKTPASAASQMKLSPPGIRKSAKRKLNKGKRPTRKMAKTRATGSSAKVVTA